MRGSPDHAAWFPFPAITPAGEGTLLGGASYMVALTDRPEVRAAIARSFQQALADDRLRFDASDLMPQPVWEAFNAGMVTITLEGPDAVDGVLAELDATWDEELAAEG